MFFQAFLDRLDKALKSADWINGSYPPYDAILVLKVVALQALYNLSGEQAEFMNNDRLSSIRYLGLGMMNSRRHHNQAVSRTTHPG